jgi:hypothetical protein
MVWTYCRRDKYLVPAGSWTSDCQTHSLFTIITLVDGIPDLFCGSFQCIVTVLLGRHFIVIKMKINGRFLFCREEWHVHGGEDLSTMPGKTHFKTVCIKNFSFYRKITFSQENWYLSLSAPVHAPVLFHACSAHLKDWHHVRKIYIVTEMDTGISDV